MAYSLTLFKTMGNHLLINKYKDEEAHFVIGKHVPIISEALYFKVQEST
jgi:hypothetical protein